MTCDNCPLRLFNPKGHKIEGVGTTIYGNMIVIPYVDKFAYKYQNIEFEVIVNKLKELVSSSTGDMLLDYCYITPFIKCRQTERCVVDDNIAKLCMENLKQEFVKYNPTNILLLGSNVAERFCLEPVNPNQIYIDIRNRHWFTNYNPGIINHDQEKGKVFTDGFIKWFYSIKNNNFDNYELYK